ITDQHSRWLIEGMATLPQERRREPARMPRYPGLCPFWLLAWAFASARLPGAIMAAFHGRPAAWTNHRRSDDDDHLQPVRELRAQSLGRGIQARPEAPAAGACLPAAGCGSLPRA